VRASTLTSGTYASDFHTFAVEWDGSAIRYFIDDTLYYTVSRSSVEVYGEWVFSKTFYVILNQAVGGHFDGDPQSDTIFPATMLIDYVRVYRRS
jgi:beta-glucanase (GH16 family)